MGTSSTPSSSGRLAWVPDPDSCGYPSHIAAWRGLERFLMQLSHGERVLGGGSMRLGVVCSPLPLMLSGLYCGLGYRVGCWSCNALLKLPKQEGEWSHVPDRNMSHLLVSNSSR
jgi:hypothetical protein